MSPSVDELILRHFGLRENPFGVTPDPRFLFMSRTHREALASLVNGIECGFGFQMLVAQPGMGKTTLLFDFLERFHSSRTAFLFQQQHDPREFLQSLLTELKSDSRETSQAKLYGQLNNLLSEAALTGKRVIVVVDEAQNLEDPLLETLRQLSNFETARSKLLQIVLAGQPQLAKKLARPEQEQLRQRISTIARLSPLGLDEARTYLNHRLNIAGYRGPQLFTKTALYLIWSSGHGIPRNMNTLCFNAMLLAFAQKSRRVDEQAVKEAAQDLDLDFVLADIAGTHEPSNGNGISDRVLMTGIDLPEKKPNRSQPPMPMRSPATNGRRLSLAEPIAKSVLQPDPEFAVALGGDLRSNSERSKGHHQQRLAPHLSSNHGLGPVIAEPEAGVVSISTGSGESTSNVQKRLQQEIPVAAAAANPVSQPSPPVAGLSQRTGTGKHVFSTLLVAAAVGVGVLFGNGLGNRSQRQFEEHPQPSPLPRQTRPVLETPLTESSKKSDPTWNAADGPEVVVRTFPRSAPNAPDDAAPPNVKAIFFEGDSSVVSNRYDITLQRIAEILAADPQATAIIEGHTDNSGEESYNVELSSRRARSVRDVLVNDYQIPPERLSTIGAGSSAPIESNSTNSGRAYNRRVEVRIQQAAN